MCSQSILHIFYFSEVTSSKTIPSIISCQELKSLLQAPPCEISVLETDFGKQPETDFQAGHIPKAQYFDQLECTTPTDFIPRGLPDVQCFEEYLTRLGVSNTAHIVLYDRSPTGFLASSRAWLVLQTHGVKSLSILNGGFHKWTKEINEIESSNSSDPKSEGAFTEWQQRASTDMIIKGDGKTTID
ncbi:unnamed protein product [Rotaria sp. Silwood2]|nr:unnamed protein product [Rotaria sp. Silwood2]CAF3994500.1 unnamed protein product [Rotaria sp. Silwood2]CAF4491927.1 unnamed protein product [Rotaria sp. Silwood2]CAF4596871.1 unnamed protein product [Rotaria sp. Silwood2]